VGLKLRRKRYFETSFNGFSLSAPCKHDGPVVSVVGHGTPTWVRKQLGFNPTITHYREAMGIDWMNRDELSQAIPPAYTLWIGLQLLQQLEETP
jgi:DNA (cytosine-5)-methyltransferase 1